MTSPAVSSSPPPRARALRRSRVFRGGRRRGSGDDQVLELLSLSSRPQTQPKHGTMLAQEAARDRRPFDAPSTRRRQCRPGAPRGSAAMFRPAAADATPSRVWLTHTYAKGA